MARDQHRATATAGVPIGRVRWEKQKTRAAGKGKRPESLSRQDNRKRPRLTHRMLYSITLRQAMCGAFQPWLPPSPVLILVPLSHGYVHFPFSTPSVILQLIHGSSRTESDRREGPRTASYCNGRGRKRGERELISARSSSGRASVSSSHSQTCCCNQWYGSGPRK